jgi:O-antigen biosynthesis protein
MINQVRWYARRLREILQGVAGSLRQSGLSGATRYVSELVRTRLPEKSFPDYNAWFRSHLRSRVKAAKALRPQNGPLFSVVVSLVRPPTEHLGECIASVRSQIYQRWQLVMVIGERVEEQAVIALRQRAESDPRITTVKMVEPAGVANATNTGIETCHGDFLCLLDPNDVLTVDALSLAALRLTDDPDIDYLYADEDKISPDGRLVDPVFRPSPSVDLMLASDVLSSPLAVRRSRVVEIGGLRESFEQAQQHDLALRLADAGAKSAHLKMVACHRRQAREPLARLHSTTSDHEVGLRAVTESIHRRGLSANARLGLGPGQYEILFRPPSQGTLGLVVLSNRPVAAIAGKLRDVLVDLPGISIRVVVVRRMIDHDGTVADDGSQDWPQGFGDFTGAVATYRGWPNIAAALNLGAELLSGTDYLLFLQDDVVVSGSAVLGQLLGNVDRADVGAVGPSETDPFAGNGRPEGLARCLRDVPALSGSFLLTKTALFMKLGGFSQELGNHFYDVAFCLSLSTKLGKRVVLDPLYPMEEPGPRRLPNPRIAEYETLAFTRLLRTLSLSDQAIVEPTEAVD